MQSNYVNVKSGLLAIHSLDILSCGLPNKYPLQHFAITYKVDNIYLLHGRVCDIAELLHIIPCNKYFVILRAILCKFAQDFFKLNESSF